MKTRTLILAVCRGTKFVSTGDCNSPSLHGALYHRRPPRHIRLRLQALKSSFSALPCIGTCALDRLDRHTRLDRRAMITARCEPVEDEDVSMPITLVAPAATSQVTSSDSFMDARIPRRTHSP